MNRFAAIDAVVEQAVEVPVPPRAGDFARGGRERFEIAPLPVEPVCQYRHGMSYSVPLSHQPRACHRVARIGGLALARGKALYLVSEKVEHAAGLAVGSAVGQFLDAMAEADLKKDAAVVRRSLAEQGLPFVLQFLHRHAFKGGEAGEDSSVRIVCLRLMYLSCVSLHVVLRCGCAFGDDNRSSARPSPLNCLPSAQINCWTSPLSAA